MTIKMIAACSNKDYVNVYGLDENSKVWRWNPVKATWEPYKIEPRSRNRNDSRSGGGVHDWDDR